MGQTSLFAVWVELAHRLRKCQDHHGADEAGGIYHAHNRANLGAKIFRKERDFVALEKLLGEALQLHRNELYAYQIMTTHWHLILRPLVDEEMGRFCKWVGVTHTMRDHAHYHTTGMGHVYQGRFKSFPIQMTITFLSAAVTLNATHCVPKWYCERKTGDGVRCGGGCKNLNRNPSCYHPGRFLGYPIRVRPAPPQNKEV